MQSFLVLTSGLILSTPVIFSTSLVSLNNLKIQKIKNIPINPPKNIISPKPIISVPKPTPALLSNYQKEQLNEWKTKFNSIILDSKTIPLSKEFLNNINNIIILSTKAKTQIEFSKISVKNPNNLLENYKIYKQEFLSSNELISSLQDKQKWSNIFENKLNVSSKLTSDNLKDLKKEFYIYKLNKQIALYEKYPYYLQPLERLKKLLYYYQNNKEYGDFQWGIDKNNKFSLEPSKYYSGNFDFVSIDDTYISNWLKYYQRWNWIFVKDKDKLPKIQDKDIQALQIKPEFKNNKDIKEYTENAINFLPDTYLENLSIIEKNTNYDEQYKKIVDYLNKTQNKYIFDDFIFAAPSIKNTDVKKYSKYRKGSFLTESTRIFNNFFWKQPNLFSDGVYRSLTTEKINPKHIRKEYGDIKVDYTPDLTDEEINKIKLKHSWIDPTPEYKKWFNHWKEVLPNIINKNWDAKTKIKAIAYYIATNSLYLHQEGDTNYNYNGYGFYNPTQIFTNDPEIQCVGYSMNLAAALTILNIPVRIMNGAYFGDPLSTISTGGHAWNEVYVDGRWKVIDLTNWDKADFLTEKPEIFELEDDTDLFLERNSKWMNHFRLGLDAYETTIMFYQNPKEYEYQDLPDSL
ncbi:transglutaminase domain-containing protein [Mycoplasma sp. 3686d]|uniref:transglutaminase domain-containing protein n=1 Tax=Mycoplasma sp. 3686d TaxID=2967300 RepID=UPI00211BD293|nr:transglutaminase domain-containing protein [Mycoplasma sp. 3686d]UUM24557.1 hypothetical protein NPA12_02545 [Mycoplasma sp. 3686d]